MIFLLSTAIIFGVFYNQESYRNDLVKVAGIDNLNNLQKVLPEL